jgi:DNA-binding transcriptional MerR regulator
MAADFDDGKDEGALRTIGEVSEALDIKTHVLRYWEQQFPMLSPLKRSGGRRYYRPGDIEMVETINQLVNVEGYTLKGAKAALKSTDRRRKDRRKGDRREDRKQKKESAANDLENAGPKDEIIAEVLPRLKAIRAKLADLVEA